MIVMFSLVVWCAFCTAQHVERHVLKLDAQIFRNHLTARKGCDVFQHGLGERSPKPDAVTAAFPKTLTQLCIVHLVRASLRHVDAGDAKAVVAGLKRIYQSASAEEAAAELDAFDAAWARKYRSVVRMWRDNWGNIIPFFQFLPEVRTVIYTTNAIESLNMSLRKLTRNRRIFPNDESVLKSLFLAIREASINWNTIHHWKPARQSFQLMSREDRMPLKAM